MYLVIARTQGTLLPWIIRHRVIEVGVTPAFLRRVVVMTKLGWVLVFPGARTSLVGLKELTDAAAVLEAFHSVLVECRLVHPPVHTIKKLCKN